VLQQRLGVQKSNCKAVCLLQSHPLALKGNCSWRQSEWGCFWYVCDPGGLLTLSFLLCPSVPPCTSTVWWQWWFTMETCILDTLWLTGALRLLRRTPSLSAASGCGFQMTLFAKLACRKSFLRALTCFFMSVFTRRHSTKAWSWGLKSD